MYIGSLDLGVYIRTVMSKIYQGYPDVIIRARGKYIIKAIETQRLVKKNLKGKVETSKVELIPESFINKDQKQYDSECLVITLSSVKQA